MLLIFLIQSISISPLSQSLEYLPLTNTRTHTHFTPVLATILGLSLSQPNLKKKKKLSVFAYAFFHHKSNSVSTNIMLTTNIMFTKVINDSILRSQQTFSVLILCDPINIIQYCEPLLTFFHFVLHDTVICLFSCYHSSDSFSWFFRSIIFYLAIRY